jgi:branched-subunit amino acid aminotransferase/4-amino-4-deoxychorismate lyase
MHANGTEIQFYDDHYSRLNYGMQILEMDGSSLPSTLHLKSEIIRLLNKNRLYKGARIRLSIFRDHGGFYTPAYNSVSYLAEATPLETGHYTLNKKGLSLGVFNKINKQADILANLKTANSLLYIKAGLYRKSAGFDDCLIINTKGRIAETISSNVFIIKSGILHTPALSEGCVQGIMRSNVLRIARAEGIECRESAISEEDLHSADECFLTNAIAGIRWVVAFGQKRYYNKTSRQLTMALNSDTFGIK